MKLEYALIELEKFTNTKVIFLGDYVDRGPESLACVELIACLVQLYPDQVFALRGNHEIFQQNNKEKPPNSFLNNCKQKYPDGDEGIKAHQLANDMFEYMSLMCIVNKTLYVHGFIDPGVNLDDVEKIQKPIQNLAERTDSVEMRLLWNDPRTEINISVDEEKPCVEPNPRGVGYLVNKAAAEKWMEANGIENIYRGHQFAPLGIDLWANGKVITVFSANRYEGRNNITAMVRHNKDGTRQIIFFKEKDSEKDDIRADDEATVYEIDPGEEEKKKEEEARKKNKEKGKKDGKKDNKKKQNGRNLSDVVPVGITLVMMLAFVGYAIAPSAPSSSSSPTNTFSQFVTNSLTLARFVNGISLGQSIISKTLDKKQLIDELFYLGPDVTLDSLAASKVSELADDIASIQKVIETECSGDDGCGLPKSILDGVSIVDGLKTHMDAITKAQHSLKVGAFDDLKKVSNAVSQLDNINTIIQELKSSGTTPTEEEFSSINSGLQKLAQVSKNLKQKSTFITDFEKNSKTLKTDLLPLKPIAGISNKLTDQQNVIVSLKTDLVTSGPKYQRLVNQIREETLQNIVSKVEFLMNVIPSSYKDRILTPGLLNGLDDIMKAASFDNDLWLKNFLTSDGNLTALSPKLVQLKNLQTQLQLVDLKFNLVNKSSEKSPLVLKRILYNAAGAILKLSKFISTYLGFLNSLHLEITFTEDVDKMLANLDLPQGASEELTSLGQFLSDNKPHLDVIAQSYKSLSPYTAESQFPQLGAYLQSNTVIKDTIDALEAISGEMNKRNLYLQVLHNWLNAINTQQLIEKFNNWVSKTGFMRTMAVINQAGVIDIIKSSNPTAKNLATLKVGNKDADSAIQFAKSLGDLSSEWVKLQSSLSSKPKRAAELNLKDAQKLSKDLGDISSITLKLDRMLKLEGDLKTLIDGKQVIESAIGGVSDPKEQDRLKKMWTSENLNALQKNLNTAKAVSDVVSKNTVVGNMSDFKAPFEKASEVEACSIDIKRLASSLNGMITDQKVAESLDSSKTLDLQFAKYDQKNVGGVINGLQSYFDSVFGVKSSQLTESCDSGSSSCSDKTTPESAGWAWWAWVLLSLGVLAIIASIVGGIWAVYKKYKSEQKKDDGDDKTPVVTPTGKTSKLTPTPEAPKNTSAAPEVKQKTAIYPVQNEKIANSKYDKKKESSEAEKIVREAEREEDRKAAKEAKTKDIITIRKGKNGHLLVTAPAYPINLNPKNSKERPPLGWWEFTPDAIKACILIFEKNNVIKEQQDRYFRSRREHWALMNKFLAYKEEEPIRCFAPIRAHMHRDGKNKEDVNNHPANDKPQEEHLFTDPPTNNKMLYYGMGEIIVWVAERLKDYMAVSTKTCVPKTISGTDVTQESTKNTRTTENSMRTATGSEATKAESDDINYVEFLSEDLDLEAVVQEIRESLQDNEEGNEEEISSQSSDSTSSTQSDFLSPNATPSTSVIWNVWQENELDGNNKGDASHSARSVHQEKIYSEKEIDDWIKKIKGAEAKWMKLKYSYGRYHIVNAWNWVNEKLGIRTPLNDYEGYRKQELAKGQNAAPKNDSNV